MSISYKERERTMKAIGNKRSYILVRVARLGNLFGRNGRNYRIGEAATAATAKTFLFRNSHVWSCDLTHPMCPTCWPKSRDSANLPYMSWSWQSLESGS